MSNLGKMDEIAVLIAEKKIEKAKKELNEKFQKNVDDLKAELEALKNENVELKVQLTEMERTRDKNEQYNRKPSLILGGGGVPLPPTDRSETTTETRALAAEIIKNKLNVNMKGSIVACHRLRNKKRMLVKFQDLDDREAVYQARFEQAKESEKVIIHENLTEKRANMVKTLGQMRENEELTNYHTKNGNIYARNSRDKRYSLIEPWYTKENIRETLEKAQNKTATSDRFMRSQTLDSIPQGRVANRAANLEEFVVTTNRTKKGQKQTRSQSQTDKQ